MDGFVDPHKLIHVITIHTLIPHSESYLLVIVLLLLCELACLRNQLRIEKETQDLVSVVELEW